MAYLLHVVILVSLYGSLALAVDLVAGLCGKMLLCTGVFASIGAYTFALAVTQAGVAPFPALLLSGASAAAFGRAIAGLLARLEGDRFVLFTVGVQIIAFWLFHNLTGLTGGAYGIPGVRALVPGRGLSRAALFVLAALLLLGVASYIHWAILSSPYGRSARAVRDNRLLAESLGKSPRAGLAGAIVVAACLSGWAGAIAASYLGYLSPTTFGLNESLMLLCCVLLGGSDSHMGPLFGAGMMVLIPELLRFLGLPSDIGAALRQCLFGVLLVAFVRSGRLSVA